MCHMRDLTGHIRHEQQNDLRLWPHNMDTQYALVSPWGTVMAIAGLIDIQGKWTVLGCTSYHASEHPYRVHRYFKSGLKVFMEGHDELYAFNETKHTRSNRHLESLGFRAVGYFKLGQREVIEFRLKSEEAVWS